MPAIQSKVDVAPDNRVRITATPEQPWVLHGVTLTQFDLAWPLEEAEKIAAQLVEAAKLARLNRDRF